MGLTRVSSAEPDRLLRGCLVYKYISSDCEAEDRGLLYVRETPSAAKPVSAGDSLPPVNVLEHVDTTPEVSPASGKFRTAPVFPGEVAISAGKQETFDGTGAVLWPCALILAEYFLSKECVFTNQDSDPSFFVVELGCGVGAASLAFAAGQAVSSNRVKQVCVTDMATTAVDRNLAVFRHTNKSFCEEVPVAASPLPWGDEHAVTSLFKRNHTAAAAANQILICATDVLYNQTPEIIALLVATIKQLLTDFARIKGSDCKKAAGRCFISFELRNDWFLFHEFVEKAEAEGFGWNNEDVTAYSRQDSTDYYCCELWLEG